MARKGRKFELAYKWLYDLDKDKYKVTSPAYLYDPFADEEREIDVLVEFKDGNNIDRKLAIECRDRKAAQDVLWIEQLQKKKEDLSLDYILATTTSKFTKGAINKARSHGVIIERAETFNLESIKEVTSNEFFSDIFFFKIAFKELSFLVKDEGWIEFKEYIKKLNFIEQIELRNVLNNEYYYTIDPHEFLKESKIKDDVFFQNDKDNSIVIDSDVHFLKEDVPALFKRKNILGLKNKIKVSPFRLSLPLNKSLSVLGGDDGKNKKYCAVFGNDEDYFEFGYIDNDYYNNMKLKKRKYMRCAGGSMRVNTLFPSGEKKIHIDWNRIIKDFWGEFDFSEVL